MGTKYGGTDREIAALNAFINLQRAAGALNAKIHGQAFVGAGHDLSIAQFGVLEALFYLGPLCQKDLAEKTLTTGGNITLIVGNLEKRKLIFRKRGKGDRRFYEVTLTDKGRVLIKRLMKPHVDAVVRAMSVLTKDEQQTLRILCRWIGKGTKDR